MKIKITYRRDKERGRLIGIDVYLKRWWLDQWTLVGQYAPSDKPSVDRDVMQIMSALGGIVQDVEFH